jgi:DNA invertase Pin-like site-specific DNA recombinase
MNVIIFARVSSKNGDTKRQVLELREYAERNGYNVLGEYEEVISGAKKNDEREALTNMMNYIQSHDDKVSKVLVWELSRIGRNVAEVIQTISTLNRLKISLYIKNYNIETLDENKEINPLTELMLNILSSINQIERSIISSRLKSGLEKFRKAGGKSGRKQGYRKSDKQLLQDHSEVVKYLKKGFSIRDIMKLTNKSSALVQKVKKIAMKQVEESG